jgi:hypothetical protein
MAATEFFSKKLQKLELQKQQAAPRALTMSTMQLKYKIHATRTKLQLVQAADTDAPSAQPTKRPRQPVTWADEHLNITEEIVGKFSDVCVVPVSFVADNPTSERKLNGDGDGKQPSLMSTRKRKQLASSI